MTNSKTTKRALFSSVVALLLCFTMLLGTTFAWFTDSAVSGNNIIKTGNLDMKLSWRPYGADHAEEWAEVTENTVLFGKDALYEPGYTEAVWLKVENLGSLAFRYDLAINVANEKQGTNKAGEKFCLSDHLEVKYMTTTSTDMESDYYTTRESLDSFAFGAAANSGVASLSDDIAVIKNGVAFSASDATNGAYSSAYVLVVISMPTTVGNEANHNGSDIPQIDFSLTALATQLAYEGDGFGTDYDKDATYEDVSSVVTNEADFLAALAEGGNIKLGANISLEGDTTVVSKSATIDLNGYTLSSNRNYKDNNESTTATLHITGADTKVVICGNGAVVNNYQGDLASVDLTKSGPNTFAIYVNGGADLTIMDGTYKSFGSAVYIGAGSVNIQGGFFESDTSVESEPWYTRDWEGNEYIQFLANVVNCSKSGYNNGNCTVEILGGTFVNEDPSLLAEGWELQISHVAEGYKVVSETQANGDIWYTVVAE